MRLNFESRPDDAETEESGKGVTQTEEEERYGKKGTCS